MLKPLTAIAAVVLLAGCSASTPAPAPAPTQVVAAPAVAAAEDVTAKVKEAAAELGALVTKAELDGQLVRVDTTIVDPRGAAGSEPARQAVAICQAVVDGLAPASVTVNEADGTGFAVYRGKACAEV